MRFKSFLLLEHDMDKTWGKFGEKIHNKLQTDIGGATLHGRRRDDPNLSKDFMSLALRNVDPTQHGEYSQWIANHYANGGINKFEDIASRVAPALSRFHNAKVRRQLTKHGINPDINQHKGLGALEDAVDKLPAEEKTKSQIKASEATHIDEPHWHIIIPHTEAASKLYGAGTRWCTAADKHCMFDSYNDEGHLHIMIPKKPRYEGEKYQLHLTSAPKYFIGEGKKRESFMNEKDRHAGNSMTGPVMNKMGKFPARPSPYIEKQHVDMDNILNGQEVDPDELPNPAHRIALAFNNPGKYLRKLTSDSDANVRRSAILNLSNENPQHAAYFDKATKDEIHKVRAAVASRGNEEHRRALRNDPEPYVRHTVAIYTKDPDIASYMALNDKVSYVRTSALTSLGAENQKDTLDKMIMHPNRDVRFDASNARGVTYEHLKKLANDPDAWVRSNTREHPKLTDPLRQTR